MKNALICLISLLCLLQVALGETKSKVKNKKPKNLKDNPVRQEMSTISGHIRDMGLYIASEQEFLREENKPIIQKHLEELTTLFKNLKVHPVIEAQGLKINQSIMSDQLDQTLGLFNNNKKSLARAKFNTALNLCISCHTQSPGTIHQAQPKVFADKDISKLKINDYEKAELLFITRDFEAAMSLYDKLLRASKKTDDDEFISKALERQLIYLVKFKKSFPEAKTHFENYLKANLFNDRIVAELKEWVKTLSGKSLWEQYDPVNVKEEDMEKFMKSFIADDEEGPIFSATNSSEVYDLNLSTILIDYYNAHSGTKLGAKILYWLAAIDKRVNDELFFSLGDYYLIACMEGYPKDPVAKDCYESYLEDLEINYLSKDKDFPPAIKAKLRALQKLVGQKDEE